ncbi:hypothetical protein BDR05DRAFT_964002 [Suillus weaverae]|nr:hypothetical protein BDR05DRAFT_964002 [Suillus weaverae]
MHVELGICESAQESTFRNESSIGDVIVNGAPYHSVGPPSSTTILEPQSGRKKVQSSIRKLDV